MRRALLLALGLALFSGEIHATDEIPALGNGPLLARAPALSRWTIAYTYDTPAVSAKNGTAPSLPPSLFSQVTVAKMKATYHRKTTDLQGHTSEAWWRDGILLTPAGPSGAYFLSDGDNLDPAWLDYHRSDFPELDWVARDFYKGIETVDGSKCLVFEKGILPADVVRATLTKKQFLKNAVATTVWISVATRLPVRESVPGGYARYTFQSGEPFALPADAVKELKVRQAWKTKMTRPAPPP